MNAPREKDNADNPRLVAAMHEYMASVEAGRRINHRELLARYPDVAEELSECLQGLAFVQSAAAEIGAKAGDEKAVGPRLDAELDDRQPLGDFRLVREIGRGGMGVVYEAVQLSLGRRVAVKVLPLAGALDPRQLQRFRTEAQAAAQLHHTNIVPVYAVGYERSVHFYAMQFIEGQSLAEVIQELRQTSGRDEAEEKPPRSVLAAGVTADAEARDRRRRALSASGASPPPTQNLSAMLGGPAGKKLAYFKTVARLGMQAAEALEYAHQFGVVHRDVKPANLLLDVHGTLWITDFGLAQLQAGAGAAAGLTQPGDMLGTYRYMSPEQASGKAVVLDQRTDVYSLGLTLYELLTLERAVVGETREQLLYQIGYVDPRPPRQIDRTIPPELELIVAKATAKEPAERYATARAMADDLRRFLQDEPILARPPSMFDKAIKWTRRHRSVAVSAVIVLVLATVALLVSTVLIAGAQARTKAALDQERKRGWEAMQQRIRADNSLEQARQAIDFFAIAAETLPREPRFLRHRQTLLEAALEYYQGLIDQRQDDAQIAAELAAAKSRAASLLAEIGAVNTFMRLAAYSHLIDERSVQNELLLSDQQIEKARLLADEYPKQASSTQPVHRMMFEQRVTELRASIDEMTGAFNDVLTPAQFERLKQIARQVRGLAAFSDTDVAEALALTKEQKERISRAMEEAEPGLPGDGLRPDRDFDRGGPAGPRGMRFGPGPGPGGPTPAAQRRHMAENVAKIVETFTPQQAHTWLALTGPRFDGEIRASGELFGGPPVPRRRPGPGPGNFGPEPRRGPPPR